MKLKKCIMEQRTGKEAQEDAIHVTGKVTLPLNVLNVNARHVVSWVTVLMNVRRRSQEDTQEDTQDQEDIREDPQAQWDTQRGSLEETNNVRSRKTMGEEQTYD